MKTNMPTKKKIRSEWEAACEHLSRDPAMGKIIAAVGPCMLKPRRDHFVLLCLAIFSQQISTKVAKVCFARFRNLFPRRRPTPQRVIELLTRGDESRLKGCGISRQKKKYLVDLARHFLDDRIPNRRLARMEDEEIIERLTAVNGIGRWTAEMFLIATLNRPDVWPVDDLGLQAAVKRAHGLKDRPTAKELRLIGEKWRPYRTVASWYLWRASDAGDGW
jgi:DNA-3-methyladenine glycosylase II